jgi:glycosyltransferase involved in cell wall biosynthesis
MHLTYDMRIGGTEMVIKNLIEGSDPTIFDMSIFCIETPIGPWGIEMQNTGVPITATTRKLGFDKSLIFAIRNHLKANNINIIHCHQYTPWVYGVLAALGTKTKVIFTEHGRFYPDSSTSKRKLINPVLNLFTHHVTAISKATKHALIEFENIPAKAIEVIYNGIAPLTYNIDKAKALRKSLNIPENHMVLGTVARFDPIKNHTMMIKSFAKVLAQQPECTLLIVGDGEERNNIEQCIAVLGLEKNVILVGYEPKPAEHIAIMDIFLLSSLSEGTSMTLLEAMSIGKPCVVTDAGGNPEIIGNNLNGKVTPNNNIKMFGDAIAELLQNRSKLAKYSKATSETFNKKFIAQSMNKKYETLYLKCN